MVQLNEKLGKNLITATTREVSYPMYWVILEKGSFGIFRIILVSKEEKRFTIQEKKKCYL